MVCYLCGLLPGAEAVASFTKRTVSTMLASVIFIYHWLAQAFVFSALSVGLGKKNLKQLRP